MKFAELRLSEPLLRAIDDEGYSIPSPIQAQAIPHLLEGVDLLGCAQTGTGKTAAFALPILHRLDESTGEAKKKFKGQVRPIRTLVLTPTRELASQVGDNFRAYGRHTELRHTTIFGGVNQYRQVQALRKGVDILVATPGRLLDLMNQKVVHLHHVETFVLDEADRMLDMGFIHDIRRVIAALPAQRQNLMFSATMPKEIQKLADTILNNPAEVRITPTASAAETVDQSVCFVSTNHKTGLLEYLLEDQQVTRALVFTRTKRRADRVTKSLRRARIKAEAIHSDKSQNAREKALADFKRGTVRVLVASDIASRGVDVDQISHVFNYDMAGDAETYIHRIGRTGRAGATGQAISFCSEDEYYALHEIEKLLGKTVSICEHPIEPPIGLAANTRPDSLTRSAKKKSSSRSNKSGWKKPRYSDRTTSQSKGKNKGKSTYRKRGRSAGTAGKQKP